MNILNETIRKHMKKNIPKIEKCFTEEKLMEFSHTPPEDLEKYNVGLGTMIRLKLLNLKVISLKNFPNMVSTTKIGYPWKL